jgi:hypothetical protein
VEEQAHTGRTFADLLLFGITSAELALLSLLTPTFTLVDWIYLSQHLLVLGIALTRRPPTAQDRSVRRGRPASVLVTLAARLIVASLVNLGRWFGIRPALR